jgi:hypothetical protein
MSSDSMHTLQQNSYTRVHKQREVKEMMPASLKLDRRVSLDEAAEGQVFPWTVSVGYFFCLLVVVPYQSFRSIASLEYVVL